MKRRQTGLTLVELMVTLAAAIILLAVGLPFFGGIIGSNQATSRANSMLTALRLARSEAVSQGGNSYLCAAVTTLPVASPGCASSSPDWRRGWIAHTDDTLPITNADILRVWEGLGETGSAAFTAYDADCNTVAATQIAFSPLGTTQDERSYSLDLDDSSVTGGTGGVAARCIYINRAGQIRVDGQACVAPSAGACP